MSSNHGELTLHAGQAIQREPAQRQSGALDVLQIIDKLATTPNLSLEQVQALTQLVALQERKEEQIRRERFFEALAVVQSEAPRIAKNGLMDRGPGKGQIPFAKREDIDAAMRPIYQKHGFSVNWDSPMVDGKLRVIGRFTAFGHTEQREWWCAPDSSGGKQGPQAAGSTVSYGQRYISIMFWDVITEGEDQNGAAVSFITEDQARTIADKIDEVKADKARFLKHFGIEKLSDLKASRYGEAVQALDSKRRG